MRTYLQTQVDAGAQVVQLFDTWAGLLSRRQFERWALPAAREALAGLNRGASLTNVPGGTANWAFTSSSSSRTIAMTRSRLARISRCPRMVSANSRASPKISSRPIGSAAGFVVYAIFYLIAPNRRALPSPVDPPKPRAKLEVAADVARHDAYVIREPLLTLLTAGEQRIAAERFGYDYRRTAPLLAAVILFFCVIGVVSSWVSIREGGGPSAFVSLVVAGMLALEQIIRLNAFRRGPAGSVLAFFVRPFARKVIT